MQITNVKNPRFANVEGTAVVVSFELGGEPMEFAATPTDTTDHGPLIYSQAISGIYGPVEPYVPPPPPEVIPPRSITRRQCAKQLLSMKLITTPEAKAMTRTGEPPAIVAAIIASLPAEQRDGAEIDFAAENYERANPLLIGIMTATGAASADIDDFFRAAATL